MDLQVLDGIAENKTAMTVKTNDMAIVVNEYDQTAIVDAEVELNRFRSYWIGKGPNTTPDWVQKLISDLKRYRSEPGHQKTQGSQSGGPDHDRPAVESM